MKIKKILAGIIGAAVLIPTFIYTVGTLTQFIHSGAAWTQGGSNFSEAPIRVKVDLDHCLAALLDFPYCLIATGIFIGAVVYGLYKIGELGNPKNKGAGIDGNIKISKGHELGSSEFLSGSDIRDTFDISKAENTIKDILGVQKDGKVICLKGGYGFNEHLAVCGSSGSGKSRCISRNLIMQCALRGESIVVTDPKGELYADCADYLKNKGYNVKVFNLSNMSAGDSWNILGEVHGSAERARILASVIMAFTNNAKDSFWANSEMNLLLSLLLYASSPLTDVKDNMRSVYKLITENSETDLNMRMRALRSSCERQGYEDDDSIVAVDAYSIFNKGADNVRGNVITGIGTALQIFQTRDVENITSYDEIDLSLPGREKCAYFCIVPDQHGAYSMLSSLFFTFLFIDLVEYADRQEDRCLPVKVKFILDEFTNCCIIPDFEKKCSTIRSRGMSVAIFFQTIGQMKNRFGNNSWSEILGACDTNILLGTDDNDTADYYSAKTGETTVITENESKTDSGEYRTAINKARRMLLTPDEIQKLGNDEELIFVKGRNVMRALRYDYTRHPQSRLLIKTDANTHLPEWKIHPELHREEYPVYTIENLREKTKSR